MRREAAIICLLVAAECVGVICNTPASAQAVSVSDSTALAQISADTVSDVFIGKGTKGPYVLSWKNIEAGETVILAGRKLTSGLDYTIDYAAGAVAFAETMSQGTVVRVTYRRTPGKAQQNGGLNLPLSMRLLDTDRGNLAVMGFYKGDGSKRGDSAFDFYGLSGGMKLGASSELSSTFLISPDDGGKGGADLADRSAMKLGTTTSIGALSLKGSFARSGEHFTAAKSQGFQHARELLELSGAWGKPSDVVSASFSYKEQEDLGGARDAASQTVSEQKVVLALPDAPKLTLSRSESQKERADGVTDGISTESIQLEKGFGDKTSATATLQRSESVAGESRDEVRSTSVAVQSSQIEKVQLQGGVTWKDSDATGGETGVDMGVKATPTEQIRLDASYSNRDSDRSGEQTKTALKLAARPIDQMMFEASYAGRQATGSTGEQHRGLRMEAKPVSYVRLTAGLTEKEAGVQQQTSKEAGIELAPNDRVRITSSFRELEDGQVTSTVADYSGIVRPAGFIELSGGYRSRQTTGAEDLDSSSVSLAMDPWKSFRLTGQYARNPEDKRGNVQRLYSTALGVEMKLGVFGITGAYAEKEEYLAGTSSLETELGLNLPLFGSGMLSTGYKMALSTLAGEQETTTYSIGYTHVIGSSFNLSLTGELTRWQIGSAIPSEEYKATAKLGLRF